MKIVKSQGYAGLQKPSITRDEFFYKHLQPRLQNTYLQDHFSSDMFWNISRSESGFDKRRNKKAKAAAIEVDRLTREAMSAYGTESFEGLVDQLTKRLVRWYAYESDMGATSRLNARSINYEKLHEILPDMQPFMVKNLIGKISNKESLVQQIIKKEFQNAYILYENTGSSERLETWDAETKAYYKNSMNLKSIFKSIEKNINVDGMTYQHMALSLLSFSPTFNPALKQAVESQDSNTVLDILRGSSGEILDVPQFAPLSKDQYENESNL